MAQTTFSGPIRRERFQILQVQLSAITLQNVGQVVMSQSIMIDAAVAAGTTTYNVGVIPKNSQLLTVILRVAIASDQGTTATVSVGKKKQEQQHILVSATDVKTLGETTTLATGALDEADRFDADTQITATLIAVGTTATTGQVSVTFTYVQANNLSDATAV
jgi:predicted HNH restriction endonuclease